MFSLLSIVIPSLATLNKPLPVQCKQTHNENKHTHTEHSQDFFVLLPAHNEAKGFACHLQRVVDGAGWVNFDAADVLMGNLKPLLMGIVDLRRGNNYEHGLVYPMVMLLLCGEDRYLCPLLFRTAIILNML